jgi:glyoxylase-like metal-dependent hydrolase (beta-lactamase superfamily II)
MALEVFSARPVGPLGCNCYIVGDPETKQAVVIDPGGDADILAADIADRGLEVVAIVATHAHFDHVLAAERLRALTGAAFHLHPDDRAVLAWMKESGRLFLGAELPDPPEVDTELAEGDRLRAGAAELEVIHTPGHTPGSVALLGDGALFSGDTLFAGSVGRTDLPGGDTDALVAAIKAKLFPLDDDLVVLPGHGPKTTIGREKLSNPFVGARAGLWLPGGLT